MECSNRDMSAMYQTIRARFDQDVCFIQIYRPEANNTINNQLINEFGHVLNICEQASKIVVLEGLPEVFCFGADFGEIEEVLNDRDSAMPMQNPGPLYDVWLKLATGPFLTIAHVKGKVNAGGVGFVAACDIVLSENKTMFSLSELLFGLMPACVLPFLIRRTGFSKAHYLTLMTQPISAQQALEWGLVDACEADTDNLLRKHLLRLKRLNKQGILRYKQYMNALDSSLLDAKPKALEANLEVFSDTENLEKIARYVKTGQFPWEQ